MTIKRWDGAAYQDVAALKRWDGAAYQDITQAKRWDGAAWQDITLPGGGGLSVVSSAGSVGDFDVCLGGGCPLVRSMTSNAVTVTATGGVGAGPTIAWTRISGSSAIGCNSPTAFTTTFSANVPKNTVYSAVYRATVTRGVDVRTVDVSVVLEYVWESGA